MSDEKSSLINIELIPKELITNTFGPATKSIGEGLGGVANFVMGPLRKLNVISEKSYQDFVEKVNCKTDIIPDDNRDISKLGLALKVMEDSRYQLENEDMREYFSNLIAGLIDSRKNESASPRFSLILSNLTTNEATVLNEIYTSESSGPVVSIRFQNRTNGQGVVAISDLLLFEDHTNQANVSINSLESYGLISISDNVLAEEKYEKIYKSFEHSTECEQLKSEIRKTYEDLPVFKDGEVEFKVIRKSVSITQLGLVFCSMIFPDEGE